MKYATALFDRETVERWLGYLRRVLEEMAADDAKPVDRLELLAEAERRAGGGGLERARAPSTRATRASTSCSRRRRRARPARSRSSSKRER